MKSTLDAVAGKSLNVLIQMLLIMQKVCVGIAIISMAETKEQINVSIRTSPYTPKVCVSSATLRISTVERMVKLVKKSWLMKKKISLLRYQKAINQKMTKSTKT
jgi:hypothetical protein